MIFISTAVLIGLLILLASSFKKQGMSGLRLQSEITQKISAFKDRTFSSYEEEQAAKQQLRKELLDKVEKEAFFSQKKTLLYIVNTL